MEELSVLLNDIHNIDCVEGMKKLPDNCIDLVVTSPPYNVDIPYDTHKDNDEMDVYFEWCKVWLGEIYRVLKDDGRIAINIPYEVNVQDRGGRVFITSEYWQMMKQIGFGFFGLVDLKEVSPHRSKTTAWGSWMSPSSPYIYNPKECMILAYKKDYKKNEKGVPQWGNTEEIVGENKNGDPKVKKIYSELDKKEFMSLVYGQWEYQPDTRPLTKATFSFDIPMKAIKILTYKGDIVLDPFSGSGTTALIAKMLRRNYIGFELSENYTKIARQRISELDYTLFPYID